MDFSTTTIHTLVWDVEEASTEEVEILLESLGYHLSQVSYMTSKEEPMISTIEVSELLENFNINKNNK
jgi:hypothetical protein